MSRKHIRTVRHLRDKSDERVRVNNAVAKESASQLWAAMRRVTNANVTLSSLFKMVRPYNPEGQFLSDSSFRVPRRFLGVRAVPRPTLCCNHRLPGPASI